MAFDGLRVVALESRRAAEMATLIRNQKGEPFVAPSMREVPIENNVAAFEFAERLFAGEFEMVIFLTGVGTRYLNRVLATRFAPEQFAEALRRVTVVARGPKPAGALRELQVPISVHVPEPNTWRELMHAIEGRPEKRIAVQAYGVPNNELLQALRRHGAHVTSVPVYQWDLPEDTGPLREAARRLADGEVDVILFTTSIQVPHLFRMASFEDIDGERLRAALAGVVVASIGPTTSETLREYGVEPDLEPSHPKMGFLLNETAARAAALLAGKRR
jgi:uroporphyrinogen-III synthase